MPSKRAVFLDRDGVLNRATVRHGRPYPPASREEVEILPGIADGLLALSRAGWLLIVVTNQPDVARGLTSRAEVEAIHTRLAESLPIDRFLTCYHDDEDGCPCRKPRPGLLLSGAEEFSIDLSASFIVGDRWRDIEAGLAAGCKTVFVDYEYDEPRPLRYDARVTSPADAARLILERGADEPAHR